MHPHASHFRSFMQGQSLYTTASTSHHGTHRDINDRTDNEHQVLDENIVIGNNQTSLDD
jgi:hypothetical protein